MLNKFQIIIYLEMILKKSFKDMTKEDFESVKNIKIELKNDIDQEKQISLESLIELLPNLTSITINNTFVNNNLIDQLKKLKLEKLTIKNCGININTSLEEFDKLQELNIINCDMLNYDILKGLSKELKKLNIMNPMDEDLVDLNLIKEYENLEELIIEKCKVENINILNRFHNLQELSLLNSNIDDIDKIGVISELDSLNDVYLPEEYKDLPVIKSLDKKVYFNLNHLVFEDRTK